METMIEAIRERMRQLLAASADADEAEQPEPWMLREWRRVSIPDWRRNLQESIDQGDKGREQDARDMLRDILFDPEYEEPGA